MTSKQKAKGNQFELEVCGVMSTNLGGNWMRVPNSGAYVGGTNSSRKTKMDSAQVRAMKGDIIPPSDYPRFNIECKSYADIPFHQMLNGSCKQLDAWLEQTKAPSDPGDVNLTVFKITRKGSYVAFESCLVPRFTLSTYLAYRGSYAVCDFESFVETNKEALKVIGKTGA